MTSQEWKACSQWDRKELKISGKAANIRNYTYVLLASIIYILFAVGYDSSTLNVRSDAATGLTGQIYLDFLSIKESVEHIFSADGSVLDNLWNQFLHYSSPVTDGLHHLDRIVNAKDFSTLFVSLLVFLLVAGFTLLIKNVLIVGDSRFFWKTRFIAINNFAVCCLYIEKGSCESGLGHDERK